jgi:hypothetical protein
VAGCALNPAAGHELELGEDTIERAGPPRRVVVAGGGPAGLEAARVLALRGHEVVLCEASDRLGGQLAIARQAPHRAEIGLIVDWHARELPLLGVEIRLGTTVDRDLVATLDAAAVVVATGARPRRDGYQIAYPAEPVAGFDEPHVHSSWDVVEGRGPRGCTVAVLDDLGQNEGINLVDRLLDDGCEVHYVSRFPGVGWQTVGTFDALRARARWAHKPLTMHSVSALLSVGDGAARIRDIDSGVETTFPIDAAVLALVPVPSNALAADLDGTGIEVQVVGDAVSPRFLMTAIHEAHVRARHVLAA